MDGSSCPDCLTFHPAPFVAWESVGEDPTSWDAASERATWRKLVAPNFRSAWLQHCGHLGSVRTGVEQVTKACSYYQYSCAFSNPWGVFRGSWKSPGQNEPLQSYNCRYALVNYHIWTWRWKDVQKEKEIFVRTHLDGMPDSSTVTVTGLSCFLDTNSLTLSLIHFIYIKA